MRRMIHAACAALVGAAVIARAQAPVKAPLPKTVPPPASVPAPPTSYDAEELERIASPIALYPDALLAQVLSAATFPSQIPLAQTWVESHGAMNGPKLADALAGEQVTW